MNHEWFIEHQTAEQYLLGELSVEDRAEFEGHFFECEECAEQVRLGFQLRENVKSVFGEDERVVYRPRPMERKAKRRWLHWDVALPIAASLIIAVLAAYQNLLVLPPLRARIASLDQPQAIETALVLAPATRGVLQPIDISSTAPFVAISLVIGAAPAAERYECDVLSDSGKTIVKIPVARIEPENELNLLIPTSKLQAGYYEAVLLAIRHGNSAEVERYRFAIRPR